MKGQILKNDDVIDGYTDDDDPDDDDDAVDDSMMAITMMMTMTTTRDDTTLESFTMECEEGEECCGSLREYFEKYFEVYKVKQIYIHIAHE